MTTSTLACAVFALLSLFNGDTATLMGTTYEAKANGPGCSEASIISLSECRTAARSLGFNGEYHIGSWNHAPYGCHVGHPTDDWAHIYLNGNLNGRTGRSIYQSICRKINEPRALEIASPGTTYEAKANAPGCSEASITSFSECQTAARSLGFNGEYHIGSWNHAPYGCHVGHPTDDWAHIYLNGNLNGRTGRSIYQSICRKINETRALEIASPGDCLDKNIDYPGNDINLETGANMYRKNSAVECQALCSQRDGCEYFTWKPSKQCWLKSLVSRKNKADGSISGPKNCNGPMKKKTNKIGEQYMQYQLTENDIEEYQLEFSSQDKDGDGTISANDLIIIAKDLGQNPTQAWAQTLIKGMDKDGDGLINFVPEFLTSQTTGVVTQEDDRKTFRFTDKDRNGKISAAEFHQDAAALWSDYTEQQIDEIFKTIDENGDNQITFEEYIKP